MSLKVIVPPHPLIKHWLSILRDKDTPNVLYNTGYEQIGRWLTYEALRDWLPYKEETIQTEVNETKGYFINEKYPIRVIAEIPEGLTLWCGSKEVIPNNTLSLGKLPSIIDKNEGIIFFSQNIRKNYNPIKKLEELENLGVNSNRILLISCLSSDKGLNEIAKSFPKQVIYTACIDKEDEFSNKILPGVGNPLLRLSTMFQ